MLPALALGAEKPAPETLARPPRGRGERLLAWPLVARAYLWLGIIEAAAAMAAFFYVLHCGGWSYGELPGADDALYRQATTACLATIVVMQVCNLFVCRDPHRSVFASGPAGNPLLLWGIAAEAAVILAIVYTPWGNVLFGTEPLEPRVWAFMLPFAVAMLVLEELRKWSRRRSLAL
jgi:magnesium-transporting ATPase (P-type)